MENYLERIDKIVVEDIIPLEDDFLMHGFLNVLPKLNQCRDKVKKLGLWTPYLSEEYGCLLYTSPSPRDRQKSRMPSSA